MERRTQDNIQIEDGLAGQTQNRGSSLPGSRTRARAWRRPTVNITPLERWGRMIVGAGAVVAGAWLLTTASGVVVIGLEILLILAGLDLIVTGALGHCPLYSKLGYVPRSLRRSA